MKFPRATVSGPDGSINVECPLSGDYNSSKYNTARRNKVTCKQNAGDNRSRPINLARKAREKPLVLCAGIKVSIVAKLKSYKSEIVDTFFTLQISRPMYNRILKVSNFSYKRGCLVRFFRWRISSVVYVYTYILVCRYNRKHKFRKVDIVENSCRCHSYGEKFSTIKAL